MTEIIWYLIHAIENSWLVTGFTYLLYAMGFLVYLGLFRRLIHWAMADLDGDDYEYEDDEDDDEGESEEAIAPLKSVQV